MGGLERHEDVVKVLLRTGQDIDIDLKITHITKRRSRGLLAMALRVV